VTQAALDRSDLEGALGLSRRLARNVASLSVDQLDGATIASTRTSILDAIGVMIAASRLGEGCDAFVEIARASGAGPSTVLGHAFKTSPVMAAMANGAMAHALDFEDTHDDTLVHPHAAAVPAALALAEALGNVSGRELITAVAAGADLACRLALGFIEPPQGRGYYLVPMLGLYAAAAACGKLLRLSEDELIEALALASCQAICSDELVTYAPSHLRAIRDAFTAKAGILGAMLAKRGVKGFDRPFEARGGLYGLHAGGRFDAARMLADLGRVYEGARVSFKPWPSCRGTHAHIEAATGLLRDHKIDPPDIADVHVTVSGFFAHLCEPSADKPKPQTAIAAKFSAPFTVALALRNGTVTLADFEPARLRDHETRTLAGRVSHTIEKAWTGAAATRGAVAIRTAAGATLTHAIEFPLGHPRNPMSHQAIVAKFRDCLQHARAPINPAAVERLIDRLGNLEQLDDVRTIFDCIPGDR
jgi:2-methylcitrate dehydratase PrpD